MLELHDIHTYYGQSHTLQGVSLRVEAGEAVALLGRNGAGKTTTISSIIGFVPARRGKIIFKAVDITAMPSHQIARRGLGLVPQGRRIFPDLTVKENVLLGARPPTQTIPRAEKHSAGEGVADSHAMSRVVSERLVGVDRRWTLARALELFPALKDKTTRRGNQLSGGEQQMVAFARALLTNPDLLLLDEPSEGLAPLIVREIGRIIGELKQAGLSILLVEQNLNLALTLADRVYVLNKGQIVFAGTPQALRAQADIERQYLGV